MKPKKTRKQAPAIEITAVQRYRLINDAAYFRSLRHRGETPAGDQAECWCEVESEIDGILKQHHAKP